MKLSKHLVRLIITLIVFALTGLMVLQFKLLVNTLELRERAFKRSVYGAMNIASDKLEEIDVRDRFILDYRFTLPPAEDRMTQKIDVRNQKGSEAKVFVVVSNEISRVFSARTDGDRVLYNLPRPQHVRIRIHDVLGRFDTTVVNKSQPQGSYELPLSPVCFRDSIYFIQFRTDSATSTLRWQKGTNSYVVSTNDTEVRKGKILQRVVQSYSGARYIPFHKRFSIDLVDSILQSSLAQQSLDLPYEFGVLERDSMFIARTSLPALNLKRTEFRLSLLSSDRFDMPETLLLHFPSYRRYFIEALLPEFLSSLVLMGIIIFCFVFTIRTIYRQRTFAQRLSDFINNMTHEFKTPISTIALASEGIDRPEIIRSKTKVLQYNTIIRDENIRMRNQVDKILQMATLEEGEHAFHFVSLNMHHSITRTAENLALQLSVRKGNIALRLNAPHPNIDGDIVHIENVLHSLLDNAIKYSAANPDIIIETANETDELIIRIIDHGIGIAAEHIENVFDKYYRVPTGNLHNVKGFGLGLSYVKLITAAHNGKVTLKSVPGKGTTVELRFLQGHNS